MPDLGEQESIFEHLRTGKINMKQAGNMLGIDTSMLAYQLAGKVAYKSYRTHGTVENKLKSFSSRLSIFYDSMSSDCDLYHAPSFKKLKAEPFISVLLRLLLFAFGA